MFKQDPANSLHKQVQRSTGIKSGTVSRAKTSLAQGQVTRKPLSETLTLLVSNTGERERTYDLENTSSDTTADVELNFAGSRGIRLDNGTEKVKATARPGEITRIAVVSLVGTAISVKTQIAVRSATPAAARGAPAVQRAPKVKSAPAAPAAPTRFAAYAFTPEDGDEIELQEGDEIFLLGEQTNGWIHVTNARSGKTGLVPANRLGEEPPASATSRRRSINNVYRKKAGKWVGGNGSGPVRAPVQRIGTTVKKTVRRSSIKKNSASDWSAGTNSSVQHNGRAGTVLGESDGIAIVQFDDGDVQQIPVSKLERGGSGAGAGAGAKSALARRAPKVPTRVVTRPARTEKTTERRYLTSRAVDGIRVDPVTGKVRKANAAHPQQRALDQLRAGTYKQEW